MKLDSIQKTLPLLLLMTMGNWACSDNDPVEEVETETVPELSIEAEVYSTLLSNYYQTVIDENKLSDSTSVENLPAKFVPSMGIVLDESRPSVRSAGGRKHTMRPTTILCLFFRMKQRRKN